MRWVCDLFLRLRGYTRCPRCGKLSLRTSIPIHELHPAGPRTGWLGETIQTRDTVVRLVNRVYCHRCGLYVVEHT